MVQGIDFCWGGDKNLVVGGESTGGNFSKCGGKNKFSAVGEGFPGTLAPPISRQIF